MTAKDWSREIGAISPFIRGVAVQIAGTCEGTIPGVGRIVVTGRFRDGSLAPAGLIRDVMLHEVGHALGMGGHSPNPEDLMYGFVDMAADRSAGKRALTDRDRTTIRKLYEKPIGTRIRAPRRAY